VKQEDYFNITVVRGGLADREESGGKVGIYIRKRWLWRIRRIRVIYKESPSFEASMMSRIVPRAPYYRDWKTYAAPVASYAIGRARKLVERKLDKKLSDVYKVISDRSENPFLEQPVKKRKKRMAPYPKDEPMDTDSASKSRQAGDSTGPVVQGQNESGMSTTQYVRKTKNRRKKKGKRNTFARKVTKLIKKSGSVNRYGKVNHFTSIDVIPLNSAFQAWGCHWALDYDHYSKLLGTFKKDTTEGAASGFEAAATAKEGFIGSGTIRTKYLKYTLTFQLDKPFSTTLSNGTTRVDVYHIVCKRSVKKAMFLSLNSLLVSAMSRDEPFVSTATVEVGLWQAKSTVTPWDHSLLRKYFTITKQDTYMMAEGDIQSFSGYLNTKELINEKSTALSVAAGDEALALKGVTHGFLYQIRDPMGEAYLAADEGSSGKIKSRLESHWKGSSTIAMKSPYFHGNLV